MLKKGYIVRLTAGVGLAGLGVILGYDAYLTQDMLPLAVSYLLFGIGSAVMTYTEMKRLEGLG